MGRQIPRIEGLVALEAVSRLGSLSRAADELGITRSAVSHRIALLEQRIGYDVLERCGKGVSLTRRGKRYANGVSKALDLLADSHDESDRTAIDGTLRISSAPGFASLLLCDYIVQFHEEYPNVELEVVTNPALDDVSDASVDAFIAFGDGNWPNFLLKKLYDVEHIPLCSPKLLSMRGGLERPADVLRFPLLHLTRRDEWSRWLAANGVEVDHAPGILFSDIMVVQAVAIAGHGVMMGNNVTCVGALSSGLLVCPYSSSISANSSYYLVIDRRKQRKASVQAFAAWLLALVDRLRQGDSRTTTTRTR